MLIAYLQVVTGKYFDNKHHFRDEKYKEKIKHQLKVVKLHLQGITSPGI